MSRQDPPKMKELRALTEQFGAVHEEQLLQLKAWPMVAFTRRGFIFGTKGTPMDAEAAVDPENKIVAYKIFWTKGTSTGKRAHAERVADAEKLASWVRTLLGADWSIVIELRIGDKQDHLYESIVPGEPEPEDPFEIGRQPWRARFKSPSSSGPSQS